MALETIFDNLPGGYNQLQRGTLLTTAQVQEKWQADHEFKTRLDLRNTFIYVGDGQGYFPVDGDVQWAITPEAENLVLRHLNDKVGSSYEQLMETGNFFPSNREAAKARGAAGTLVTLMSRLRLSGSDGKNTRSFALRTPDEESLYLAVRTADGFIKTEAGYVKLNEEEKKVLVKLGYTREILSMMHHSEKHVKEISIAVLNPAYVSHQMQAHPDHRSIWRASRLLNVLGHGFLFDATGSGSIDNKAALLGEPRRSIRISRSMERFRSLLRQGSVFDVGGVYGPDTQAVTATLKDTDSLEDSPVSRLEAAIARHQAFLELPELFTYVGLEGGNFTVPAYRWVRDRGSEYGGDHELLDDGDFSCSLPVAGEANLPVHFRDDTKGKVMEYLPRMEIRTGTPFLLLATTTTQEYQLVLKKNLTPRDSVYAGRDEKIWSPDKEYAPKIIVYPANGDFYMTKTKNSPIEEIRKFKEFIRKNTKDKLDHAKVSLQSYHQGLREEKADREKQQREAAELIRNRGMKI